MNEIKQEQFITQEELVDFINDNKIKRKDIQQIVAGSMYYTLFYWGVKESG